MEKKLAALHYFVSFESVAIGFDEINVKEKMVKLIAKKHSTLIEVISPYSLLNHWGFIFLIQEHTRTILTKYKII